MFHFHYKRHYPSPPFLTLYSTNIELTVAGRRGGSHEDEEPKGKSKVLKGKPWDGDFRIQAGFCQTSAAQKTWATFFFFDIFTSQLILKVVIYVHGQPFKRGPNDHLTTVQLGVDGGAKEDVHIHRTWRVAHWVQRFVVLICTFFAERLEPKH